MIKMGKLKQERKQNSSYDQNNIFENQMVKAAISGLSEEDKKRYKMIGDHLYGRISFEDCQSLNNMPPSMAEAVAYLETQLQAGFHPSMLVENEKVLLVDRYGDEWYKKWGYIKEDLVDIITVQPILNTYDT
jgi:hypothetical protein